MSTRAIMGGVIGRVPCSMYPIHALKSVRCSHVAGLELRHAAQKIPPVKVHACPRHQCAELETIRKTYVIVRQTGLQRMRMKACLGLSKRSKVRQPEELLKMKAEELKASL